MSARAIALQLNGLGLWGLAAILLVAHGVQLATGELPCPLCMLQRVAVVATGFGLLLNVHRGPSPAHYGLVVLAALFGLAAAGRQVLLHIVPGSGSYGSPLFGLHLYTWCVLLFLAAILSVAVLLLLEKQFEPEAGNAGAASWARAGAVAMMLMTGMTALSAFVQCGPTECVDNPTSYWLLTGTSGAPG